MSTIAWRLCSSILLTTTLAGQAPAPPVSLFDGRTLNGWQGDTVKTWRVQDGAIAGGSLTEQVPQNDFLVTTRSYGNFVLRLKFKLVGTEGFINSGVQFRSQRATRPANEMIGYQADLGANYWASLYDESRRNKTLVQPDAALIKGLVKLDDWNDYEIRAEGRRIRLRLNGRETVDYTEPDESIPQTGLIGLQIHGGGKAQVFFKDITIEELR
jgi:3-keto-disaccharide hydrolase